MREIYVMVHDSLLKGRTENMRVRSRALLARLRLAWISHTKEHYRIRGSNAREIHPDLPAPSDDLSVLVCGAYRSACVPFQHDELIKRGYNTRIYEPGCFEP